MSEGRHQYIAKVIHDRALASFGGEPSVDDMQPWALHWIKTALELKKEFEEEGLRNSARFVSGFVEVNEQFADPKKTTYYFASGWSAKREYGHIDTPRSRLCDVDGPVFADGKWVLRDINNAVIDLDKYRHDLFDRHQECEQEMVLQ